MRTYQALATIVVPGHYAVVEQFRKMRQHAPYLLESSIPHIYHHLRRGAIHLASSLSASNGFSGSAHLRNHSPSGNAGFHLRVSARSALTKGKFSRSSKSGSLPGPTTLLISFCARTWSSGWRAMARMKERTDDVVCGDGGSLYVFLVFLIASAHRLFSACAFGV